MKINDVDTEIEFDIIDIDGVDGVDVTARNLDGSYVTIQLSPGQVARLAGYLEAASEGL